MKIFTENGITVIDGEGMLLSNALVIDAPGARIGIQNFNLVAGSHAAIKLVRGDELTHSGIRTVPPPTQTVKHVPYQKCPVCVGTGRVIETRRGCVTVTVTTTCPTCKGERIIPMHVLSEEVAVNGRPALIVEPPKTEQK